MLLAALEALRPLFEPLKASKIAACRWGTIFANKMVLGPLLGSSWPKNDPPKRPKSQRATGERFSQINRTILGLLLATLELLLAALGALLNPKMPSAEPSPVQPSSAQWVVLRASAASCSPAQLSPAQCRH